MKTSKTIMLLDVLMYLMNDLFGWFIIIWFDITGYDGKFMDWRLHWTIFVIGLIHITISIICSVFLFKKGITKQHIKIGKKLFIYNIIMTLIPYCYLAYTRI